MSESALPELPEAVLYKTNGRYLFGISGAFTDFTIPTIDEVLATCKVFKLLGTYLSTIDIDELI
jgi:hypothetical protein